MVKEIGQLKNFNMEKAEGVIEIPSLGIELPFSWSHVRLLDDRGEPRRENLSSPRRYPVETEMMVYLRGRKKNLIVEFVVYKKHHDAVFELLADRLAKTDDEDFGLCPATAVA